MSGPPRKTQNLQADAGRPARFPRSARLLKHVDFDRVYREGQRHFARHMTFFYLPRKSGPARVGFTVGRVLGEAVERNRIRRRLREAVRLQLNPRGMAVDVVVNPKRSVLHAEFAEILQEMRRAFQTISGKLRSPGGGQRSAENVQ